ncbi:MAG: hypothetical protein DIU78_019870, partial [Pseudomonadota bacterium]
PDPNPYPECTTSETCNPISKCETRTCVEDCTGDSAKCHGCVHLIEGAALMRTEDGLCLDGICSSSSLAQCSYDDIEGAEPLVRPSETCEGALDVRVPAGLCLLVRGRFAGVSQYTCRPSPTVTTCTVVAGPSPDWILSFEVPAPAGSAELEYYPRAKNGSCPVSCP